MKWPQYTIRDLLWSVSLIAAGLACFAGAVRGPYLPNYFLVLLSPPCIGAGLGALRQRKANGLFLGCLISLGIYIGTMLLPSVRE